ncbi:V0D/AC39 family V-type ATPase subunit [Hespellia stercorisuis]|uniref:V/A-type H+-transporting ATPase subunit C n=1 Tax=Hespellia stercorisuis DSM 15480 TaxID=1121950 RepID=A0A1M6K5T4_9FIRM|nr:V-type ATPase subunit [Hespellia stercorisuis]SHJ54227.1 V/A-type H+-transporting ATPase subunit C [Hespellia stercorisuis DSM 15480]
MGNLLNYSGIVTKVHAMQAKLLKPSDFDEIASLHNVTEIVSYLKEKPAYADFLRDIDETKLHRGDIEKILIQSLYRDYTKLYRFSGMAQRKYLKLYLKRYEINLINYCLRIVINHYAEPFDLNYKRPFFDQYSQISIEKLIASRTTDELIDNLKGTEYYEPLHKLRESNSVTLFDYDLALDLYYFTTLWSERKKALKKKERELFTRDYGTKIDLLNIQWIYRAKKYFHMQPADIYALLVPIHYHLKTEMIKNMVEAGTPEELLVLLNQTRYAKNYDFEKKITLEQMYFECIYHLFTIDRRRNPYTIATLNTYLFLKETEIDKLTTAMECIRYSLSPGDTLAYVGGVTE